MVPDSQEVRSELYRPKRIGSIRSLNRVDRGVVQPGVEAGDVVSLERHVVADVLRSEGSAIDDKALSDG